MHNELRHDLKKSDARQLATTLTRQLVYPILAVNRGRTSLHRCPRLVLDTQQPEDIKLLADSLPKLVNMGMRIKADWAHSKLKIPMAEEMRSCSPFRHHLAMVPAGSRGWLLTADAGPLLRSWRG